MRSYRKNTENRKDVINRIEEITGQKLKYTMPFYRYVGQGFTVTRDGNLEADETADMSVVDALIAEGLILAAEDELDGAEDLAEDAAEPTEESPAEREETHTGCLVGAPEDEEAGQAEPTEENAVDAAVEETEPTAGTEADALAISLPLANHTATSIRNLVSMIYSRGHLISKATGGKFAATVGQVEALTGCISIEDVRERLSADELEGLVLEDDKITFTGFPATDDPNRVLAFTQLASQMNRMALKQKRTMAKNVDETNERYIFRIWLIALGMKGDEFKTARRILLAPLSGNAAFKDDAMANRWKEKQAAKKLDATVASATTSAPATADETVDTEAPATAS